MEESGNTSKAENEQFIKVTENGPYLVTGGVPLAEQIIQVDSDNECHGWQEGKKYAEQESYKLCRCGKSVNKPFCTGMHAVTKFKGEETASRKPYAEQAKTYEGPELTLTDAEDLCASARFCHRAGGTWNLTEQSADPEARKTAIEEACDCPSGRLVAHDNQGNAIEPKFTPSIGVGKRPAGRERMDRCGCGVASP